MAAPPEGPRSQHELRAIASMVVASLPFPPLPVVVLQGEDGADGLASSFDLLQTAVMNAQLGLGPADRDAAALARSKQATLERLQQDMAALHQSVAAEASGGLNGRSRVAWVQRAYEIYCAAFRTYFLEHYGTSSRDLRFYPLAAVAPDSLLVRQGSSHWNAGRLLAGDAACDPCGGDHCNNHCDNHCDNHFGSYTELLRAYALDLATLSE